MLLTVAMFRLCGSTLDQEMPTARSGLVSRVWALLQDKQIPLTTVHYNALLRCVVISCDICSIY